MTLVSEIGVVPFASKPAPTLDHRWTQILYPLKIKCGSGLAREGDLLNLEICLPTEQS
jgi:hypothetical protein